MKTIIIEDELPAARQLQRRLLELEMEVVAVLHSVAEAVNWFGSNPHPDLIFLDIQLGDGLSFDIFERTEVKSAVIFTTAYDEYALRAFKLNSIDYLLKPIDADELEAAIAKFRSRQAPDTLDLPQLRKLLFAPEKTFRNRLTVKIGQQLRVIAMDQVECFYSENKATLVHTSDNRDYPVEFTLDALEAELDPEHFFRISRKFIVSAASSREISMYSNSRLQLKLPTYAADEVIVARERVPDFKAWIGA